jgi:acetyl esterase
MPPVPVDPALDPILEAAAKAPPRDASAPIGKLRDAANEMMNRMFLGLAEPAPDVKRVTDRVVPVDGGAIPVRIYTPDVTGPFPAHVYFHGGGFWLGTLDQFDTRCRELCAGADCVVVSVDYRLAPEHKYPTAAEDCYAALCWTVEHAADLDIDVTRVSVGGESAGGNLSAVVALMARDRGAPPIKLQVLEIPVTDLTMSSPSIDENGEGYLLTRDAMQQYRDFYLSDLDHAKQAYASPLLADDLSGLPPALVTTAEFDPLRDEGEAYAARLAEAGVSVTQQRFDGHVHGSSAMTGLVPSARDWRDLTIAQLRDAYGL